MAVTKKIEIDGNPVEFKASAAIPRIYRNKFGRDVYKDLMTLNDAIKDQTEDRTAAGAVSTIHGGRNPAKGCTGFQRDRLCLCHARYPRLSYRQHERDAESSVGA